MVQAAKSQSSHAEVPSSLRSWQNHIPQWQDIVAAVHWPKVNLYLVMIDFGLK